MEVINIEAHHYPEISRIYLEGIATGNATFQTIAPSWDDWDKSHLKECRIILVDDMKIMGWAALTPVSSRCVYAGVSEVSVYVDALQRGKGIGKKLLKELIMQSEASGIWTLQSGIFPENKSSIRIHEECGFRIIGYREKIGNMKGIWRDNIIMERRSKVIGI